MYKFFLIFTSTVFVACNTNNTKEEQLSHTNTTHASDVVVKGNQAIQIDSLLTRFEKESQFSGVVFIAKNDSLVLCKGYGLANRKASFSFTPSTLSCIGSITKSFTAVAVLHLYAQHKLNLSDNLSKFFENVPADKKNITIHQLLTHSSGFHEFLKNDEGDYAQLTAEAFLKKAFAEPLAFKPGSKAVYTNVGMSILGIIIEKVSGTSYENYLNAFLFKPNNIQGIGYFTNDKDTSNIAIGYNGDAYWGTLQQRYALNNGGPYWNLKANGGLYASGADMYRWTCLLNSKKILPDSIVQLMFTPHETEFGSGGLSAFGYGCNIGKSKRGTLLVDNGGSNGIYFARLVRFPEEGLVFYVATNNNAVNANFILPQITQLYFDGHISNLPTSNLQQFEFAGAELIYKTILEKGTNYFEKNIFTDLKNNNFPTQDDMLFLEAGQKLIAEDKQNEALVLYKFYTKNFPEIVVAWNDLGEIYLKKGNPVEAKKCFEQALHLRPSNERAKNMLKSIE